jgi:hypothetical protein
MNQTPTNDELEARAIELINEAARLLENLPEADPGKLQRAVKPPRSSPLGSVVVARRQMFRLL